MCYKRDLDISGANRKFLLTAQIDSLLRDIQTWETTHKRLQTPQIESKLVRLCEELNSLLIDKAKDKLTRSRQTFYEF